MQLPRTVNSTQVDRTSGGWTGRGGLSVLISLQCFTGEQFSVLSKDCGPRSRDHVPGPSNPQPQAMLGGYDWWVRLRYSRRKTLLLCSAYSFGSRSQNCLSLEYPKGGFAKATRCASMT